MIRETFGAQLPPIEESHVGDRFYNTAEDKHYVFDDGEWKSLPDKPVVTGANQVYAIQTDSSIIPYKVVMATPPSVFNNVYVHDVSLGSGGDYVASAITYHGLSGEDAMTLAPMAAYVTFSPDGEIAGTFATRAALFATDTDVSHWHLALYVKTINTSGQWFNMGGTLVINSETGGVYIPSTE